MNANVTARETPPWLTAECATVTGRTWTQTPWIPCAVSLAINVAILSVISSTHPAYLSNYRLSVNPDARHYTVLGDNIVLRGQFSRCSQPPYVPDMLRTPVFPMVVGLLHQTFGLTGIYVFHALLQAAACSLLYYLVAALFGPRPAFCASFLLALDLTLTVSNFEVMSEPLFSFLNVAGLTLLLPPLVNANQGSLRRVLGGGALLGLATLTRPTGLYVPLVYVILAGGVLLFSKPHGRTTLHALTALAVAYVPAALWVARNGYVFALPRLTTADAIMLVYFFGAGGYQVEHNLSLEQAQQRISAEYELPPHNVSNNHWVSNQSVKDMDAALRRAVWPIVTKYPSSVAEASVRGIAKATVSHNVDVYAHLTGRTWEAPGLAAAVSGDRAALSRLGKNPLDMILLFLAEMAHTAAVWVLAAIGLIVALVRRKSRLSAIVTCAVLSYFLLTLAIVSLEAYWRYRTPHMPLVYIFAGVGAASVGTTVTRLILLSAK